MLNLPINGGTFKKSFLGGNGNLELKSDEDVWGLLYNSDKPFDDKVSDRIAEMNLSGSTQDLKFGDANGLNVSVKASGQAASVLQLIRPDDTDLPIYKTYHLGEVLTPGKLGLAAVFNAQADVSGAGSLPAGPVNVTFSGKAGGSVAYERIKVYDADAKVKDIIADMLGGLRLPYEVNGVDDLPAPGEVLALRYGGYLELGAGLTWGYSLTGAKSFEVGQLALELDYALKAVAEIKLGYRLAGDFSIEVRRGAQDGWAHVVLRKSRDSEFSFAADFGLTAQIDLKGLPQSTDEHAAADDFLAAVLGTDAGTFLKYFGKVEEYTSLDKLEAAVGKLFKGYVHELADKWIGGALNDATLQQMLGYLHEAVERYNNLEQDITGGFLALYNRYLGRPIDDLRSVLERLSALTSRDALKGLNDSEASDALRWLWQEKVYDLLLDEAEFQKFRAYVAKALEFVNSDPSKRLRDLLAGLKERFGLDKLFDDLGKYDTAEELQTLADEKLQGLVGKLIGKGFEELKNDDDFKNAFVKVHGVIAGIQDFKNKYYDKLAKAVHQSFEFNVNYAYTRATEEDALLDLEINLNEEAGRRLMGDAVRGRFTEVLTQYTPGLVLLRGGDFTRKLTRSAQVQVSAFGWSSSSLTQLVQQSDDAVEAVGGGLLHVYTTQTAITQKQQSGKKFKESVQSSFIFNTVSQALQPTAPAGSPADSAQRFTEQTLDKMSVEYNLLNEDEKTDARELLRYLEFAEFLQLIPSREQMVAELNKQFPSGLGKVKVSYVVKYDNAAVLDAFKLADTERDALVRQTIRQLLSSRYIALGEGQWQSRIGFALADAEKYYKLSKDFVTWNQSHVFVTFPSWFTESHGSYQVELRSGNEKNSVSNIFNVEDSYVSRLAKLDKVIDDATAHKDSPDKLKSLDDTLREAVRNFVDMADDLKNLDPYDSKERFNTFFGVFDMLVREGGSQKGARKSAMILEITPPAKETVTKYLMS